MKPKQNKQEKFNRPKAAAAAFGGGTAAFHTRGEDTHARDGDDNSGGILANLISAVSLGKAALPSLI